MIKRYVLMLASIILCCSVVGAVDTIDDLPQYVLLSVEKGTDSKYVLSIFGGSSLDGEYEAWSLGHWHIGFGYPYWGMVFTDFDLPPWKAARVEWLMNANMTGEYLDNGEGCTGVVNRHDIQNAVWKLAGMPMNHPSCIRTMLVRLARANAHKEDWSTCGPRKRFIIILPEAPWSSAFPLPPLGLTVPVNVMCKQTME